MPTAYESLRHRTCTQSEYKALGSVDENSIYFLSDTHQIFVGSTEYTKSALAKESRPAEGEQGEEGRIYVCLEDGSSFAYVNGSWVALYDPTVEVVKQIHAGDCIECDPNPIFNVGTVSHGVPSGASETDPDLTSVKLKLGDIMYLNEVGTDKFGHVVEIAKRSVTLPSADELSTVFKFKGTLASSDLLPQTGNSVGDVYYVTDDSKEYVYLESGWEELGPVVDLSGLVSKEPDASGDVAAITEDGSIASAGYAPESGVQEGTYGSLSEAKASIPSVTFDKYGRAVSASTSDVAIASPEFASDVAHWMLEQFLV